MISGVEGRIPYMTYPDPWRGPTKQHSSELFLRPAPKPINSTRYNGVNTTSPNGTRLAPPPPRTIKYPSTPAMQNLSDLVPPKEEVPSEDLSYNYARMFPHGPQYAPFHYPIYPQSYMMRPSYPPTPISPLETFSPPTPTAASSTSSTFLSPTTFSPPSAVKPGQSILRDKRSQLTLPPPPPQQVAFKVPSGKEGSLKHRILTRPEDNVLRNNSPLDLQQKMVPEPARRRLQATMSSPPRSPKKPVNNNVVPSNFAKGSLIQLANGDMKKVEDMRTEDFVTSADRSAELRLAESTVVRIEDNGLTGMATITLSYNKRSAQVEVESTSEHPYFVIGQGWASCNPERTQQCYRLQVHRLQVGDVIVSLTPRESAPPPGPHHQHNGSGVTSATCCPTSHITSTIMTTATTTAMTVRQLSTSSSLHHHQVEPINLQATLSPDSLAARKRRWSAPDQICDKEEQEMQARRHRAD